MNNSFYGVSDYAEIRKANAWFVDRTAKIRDLEKVRDATEGEKVVQSTVVALLRASGGPYFVRHEGEAGDGFYDLALVPQLDRWPDIAHAALIELKYIKKAGRKPTRAALADIRAKAVEQLEQYSADPALAAEWRLKPMQNAECRMQNGETASTLQRFNVSTLQRFNGRRETATPAQSPSTASSSSSRAATAFSARRSDERDLVTH